MKYKKATIIMVTLQLFMLICFYCIVIFGKILYMPIESLYPEYINIQNTIASANNVDVLIIGDSRAKAGFMPNENTKNSSINLAVGGSTPITGFYILREYLKHNKPPKVIIVSYAPHHFVVSESYFINELKSDVFSLSEIYEIFENVKLLNECDFYNMELGGCNIIYAYIYRFNINNFIPEIYDANFLNTYKSNLEAIRRLGMSMGHTYYGRDDIMHYKFAETTKHKFKIDRLISKYLSYMQIIAKENNINIVFYVMPYNKITENSVDKNFIFEYKAFIQNMQEHYGIVPLNEPYAMPNKEFGDHSHLYRGAKQVTQDIWNKLYEKQLLP